MVRLFELSSRDDCMVGGIFMELTVELFTKWMINFKQKIDSHKQSLNDLDEAIGDGDHGSNMVRGMDAVVDNLTAKKPSDLTDALKITAMSLISKVGGASGPLYGTAFLEMAKKSTLTNNLSQLLETALQGIMKRGGAQIGDKTLVDVWSVLVKKLALGKLTDNDIKDAVDSTRDLIAHKGRASYLGERSKGHLDPGSVSSGYLFESLLEAEESKC